MAKDYKDTLNLPSTEFKMRGNLGESEKVREEKWKNDKLYEKVLKKNKTGKPFILHDGPPYANGDIHVGHALNKILKDFIVRYKTMACFYAPYVPGWDTHGLPIETAIRKQKGQKQDVSLEEYLSSCRDFALKQVARQKGQFIRLGVLGDFDNPYLTLNKKFEANELRVFAKLIKDNLVYQGLKPVYWSYANKTALAEAEIIYEDVKSESIFVIFNLTKNQKDKNLEGASLLIWTTTPWTLPANLAVSANPKIEYGLYDVDSKKILLSKNLSSKLFKEFEFKGAKLLKSYLGKDLENLTYIHPLYDNKICPVILGEHVLNTDGTGLVHTAPGHGTDDYIVGQAYGLDVFSPIDENAVLTEEAGQFKGLFYEDANKEITKYLKEQGTLIKSTTITHSYPHDWRSHTPVIFRSTPQWFCDLKPMLPKLKKAINNVDFIPKWGQNRLQLMMENRTDWCISRQRLWGVPIPILYDENDNPILDYEIIMKIADKIEKEGSIYWHTTPHDKILSKKDLKGYKVTRKETDTLDVWFDSGTSFLTIKDNEIDLYLEGTDQYRGWFNSSLVNGVAMLDKAPYKMVISHGFVLDGKGQKMSKSLGNVIDPNKVCQELGADVLRLWVLSVDWKEDVPISDDLLKQTSDAYRKIRNTMRFLLGNLGDFNYEKDYIGYSMRSPLDQVMTIKLYKIIEEVLNAYEAYDFQKIYRTIMPYIINDLSSFYLDTSKDAIYILKKNDHKRRSIQSVLYDNLFSLIRLLTPIIPHTTAEVYEHMNSPKKEIDPYMLEMPKMHTFHNEKELLKAFDLFSEIRDHGLKEIETKREQGLFNKSLEADLIINAPKEHLDAIKTLDLDLRDTLMIANYELKEAKQIKVTATKTKGKACARCWNYHNELDSDDLCDRCSQIVKDLEK